MSFFLDVNRKTAYQHKFPPLSLSPKIAKQIDWLSIPIDNTFLETMCFISAFFFFFKLARLRPLDLITHLT